MFAWNLVRMRKAGRGRARAGALGGGARQASSAATGSSRGSAPAAWARCGAPSTGCSRGRPRSSSCVPRRCAIRAYAPKIRERFRREAQTLASMRSRHTIALYDYGVTDDGTFYYVMELLDGVDLDQLVRELRRAAGRARDPAARAGVPVARRGARRRPAPPRHQAARTCSRAAPPTRSTSLKLLDFGIVHTINEPTADPTSRALATRRRARGATPSETAHAGSARCVGTPGFIAPEQIVRHAIDGARRPLRARRASRGGCSPASEVFARDDEESRRSARTSRTGARRCAPRVKGWLPAGARGADRSLPREAAEERPDDARALLARAARDRRSPPSTRGPTQRARAWWHDAPAVSRRGTRRGRHVARAPARAAARRAGRWIGPVAATLDQRRSERALRRGKTPAVAAAWMRSCRRPVTTKCQFVQTAARA